MLGAARSRPADPVGPLHVTDNKIYCVYRAPNEDMVREHAQRGGFPANKISQVRTMIDPTTAE